MQDSLRPVRTYVFPVELVAEPDGRWSASCPALPGCATWGGTRPIALRNIQEAVETYAEDLDAAGEPVATRGALAPIAGGDRHRVTRPELRGLTAGELVAAPEADGFAWPGARWR